MQMKRALASLLVAGTLMVLLAACGRTEPEVTPAPTLPPTTDTPAPMDAWSTIQQNGKLVVGTSADYPPFEYYNENFKITGFDIDLMTAIGERLGLKTEYRDFAFEGLYDALTLGQVDIVISAVSQDAQRAEFVDFSNVYFVSEDAFLVQGDSDIKVDSIDDVSQLRVAVQGGSVYEQWVQETLVDEGLLPQRNLQVYRQIDGAIEDLGRGRIDVVVLDKPVAERAASGGDLKVAASGLNRQRFAIVMPKGSDAMRTEVNRALAQLQTEGFLADLSKQHMDLEPEEIVPLPTPEPATPTPPPTTAATATPAPPAACTDGMAWVADLNLDDHNMTAPPIMRPGQAFTKSWRIRNTGTCTWNSTYFLGFVQGNVPAAQMGGQPTPIIGTVAPGATYDISVNLVAPIQPGVYQGWWQMSNGQSTPFGQRIYVGIQVPASATPTPAPTATPTTGISFTVDRTSIRAGECVTFSWNVTNAREVYFYALGQPWQQNGVAGQAQSVQCPPVTTTYELRVVQPNNETVLNQITINVQAAAAPAIARFTVEPSGQTTLGQCITMQWDVQGQTSRVVIRRDNTALWDNAPLAGSLPDCPAAAGSFVYSVEATGPGGVSRAQLTTTVVSAATATPAPTPAPQLPVINLFSIAPIQVNAGECVTGQWSVGGGAIGVRLLKNGDIILDGGALVGTGQDCDTAAGQVLYRLVAYNAAGQSVFQEQLVDVIPVEIQPR